MPPETATNRPPMRWLDDVEVGFTWHGHPIAMDEADIIAFAKAYDPQPMHIDPEAAASGRFGTVIASGWHVAALVMRDYIQTSPFGDLELLGLGLDDLAWSEAVHPGDTLVARREIVEVRPSRSKPDRGVVRIAVTVSNQHDRPVMRYVNAIQMFRKPG